MKLSILQPAQKELGEAVTFYNSQAAGLGFEFLLEFQHSVRRVKDHPEAWPLISQRTRRCRLKRFPYGIIYQLRENEILIVSVMHLHQRPDAWKENL